LVFGPDVEQTVRHRDALPGLSLRTPPIALGHCEGHRSLFDLAEGLSDEAPEVAVEEADDALILYTSRAPPADPKALRSTTTASCGWA